jgi:Rne/Rng family ribonuclease
VPRPQALWLSRARGRSGAALRENGRIVALDFDDGGAIPRRGRIVRGRVRSVLPGTQGAFVEIDGGATGFLPAARGAEPRPGQEILVQLRRSPRAGKLAELGTRIELAGRYLVLDTGRPRRGVSRRVRDPASRARVEALVAALDAPPGAGWIARAACVGADATAVRDEARRLIEGAREVTERSAESGPPERLVSEPDFVERVLFDAPGADDLEEIRIDDLDLRASVAARLPVLAPELLGRVQFVSGAGRLHDEAIGAAVDEALSPRVPLPSGGTVTIEETTALVAVDVDSGSSSPERANLEAAHEIPRQLRLRDLGGAIVIDWISLRDPHALEPTIEAFRLVLARDPARTRIVGLSDLGLLQLTRERLGPGPPADAEPGVRP